jgi:amino acid adenylation domain-containing protein
MRTANDASSPPASCIVPPHKNTTRGAMDTRQPEPREHAQEPRTPGPVPLTPQQHQLWVLDRMHAGASMYNLAYAFAIEGALDVSALQRSLRELVARHDALRMRVLDDAAQPQLQFDPELELAVPVIDAGATLMEQLQREAERAFDLARGPLFRAAVYRTGAEQHVLFFGVHHIAADGWSIEILLDELATLYAGYAAGGSPKLPALSSSYARHAAETQGGKVRLARASARLRGIEPLELPTDRPRPAVFGHRGASCWFSLSPACSRAIKGLAAELGTTPYTVLLAAYKLLLARYTGQSDIVVGSPVAGRARQEDEAVVGFFARTLVMRTDLGGTPSFRELVARVEHSCFGAFADAGVPFERLVEALALPIDRSRTPVFQTLFSLRETRPRVDPRSGRAWKRLPLSAGGAKTELTLLLEHDGEQLHGELEYSSELFEAATVERLIANYERLIDHAVREPDAVAARLDLLSDAERSALARLNDTARAIPEVGGFHELFRAQAERDPSRTAIVDQQGSVSYGELDRQSDAWAAYLAARGIGRGARVGVAVGRSRRVLEVNLGVLKAGAAYVPLDTNLPRERLAFMADDAGLACILAERATLEQLPDGYAIAVVEDVALPTAAGARVRSEPDDIAYIIYTSGSTGQPKGVEVRHGGVVNLLTSMAERPGCTRDDRVMAVSTFSFDMCIAELYLPLAVGARTILAPRTCAADGEALSRFIDEYGATLVQATPTTFTLLVDAGLPKQRFKAIGGGEPFPGQLARALAPCCSEVWNGYGPTETTVYATFYRIDDPDRPVRIGLPIANTQLYVLDALQQPVPLGVAGELYIGGAGVSAGYRNRDELTRERFLPDPFAAGAKMYRTGDLVRMHADGVQYVGRTDNQVKLRGYRIELGEIEARLARHEQVEHAVVLVRELGENDKRLVAYVVLRSEVSAEQLRAYLTQQLPSYMVPRWIVPLSALPTTPSGKVDRKLLPDPRELVSSEEPAHDDAASATERALLEVWQRVLGSREFGVQDDFFSVGGHSLLAVQLVKEINRTLHTRLSLGIIFEAPTVRKQAARIDRGEHGGGASLVPLRKGGARAPLFCICGIDLYQSLAAALPEDTPVYGTFLPIEGELFERPDVELDVPKMARQYLEAMRIVQPHGPYYLAGVSFGGALAYEIARQLRAEGEPVGLLALLDTILPSAFPSSRARRLARGAVRWARSRGGWLAKVLDALPELQDELVCDVRNEIGDGESTDHLLQRMRLYRRAFIAYEAAIEPYAGDVLLVRAGDRVEPLAHGEPDFGWSRHVRGKLMVREAPGDHLGLLRPPHVAQVAALLAPLLEDTTSRPP